MCFYYEINGIANPFTIWSGFQIPTSGERTFTFENGKLFYQRTGKPKFELEAMSLTVMKGKGNNYFKIEFVQDEHGKVNRVNAYYQDDRIETSTRTEGV